MRLDHLLSKETSDEAKRSSVTSYWSVQSVKVFTLFNLEGTGLPEDVEKTKRNRNKAQRSGFGSERRNKATG